VSSSSSPSASPQKQYRYYVKELGSLNGLYIDGFKVRHRQWAQLHEGARLCFAPQSELARQYSAAFCAMDAANEVLRQNSIAAGGTGERGTFVLTAPVLPAAPLTHKDLHIEYVFTHDMNDAARQRLVQLNSVMPAGPEANAPPMLPPSDAVSRKRGYSSVETAPTAAAAAAAAASSSVASAHSEGPDSKRARTSEHQGAGASADNDNSALSEFSCSICTDTIYRIGVLDCGHSFCRGCIDTWFKKNKTCPECRVVHRGAVNNVRAADNAIEKLVQAHCTEEEKSARAQRIALVDMNAKLEAIRLAERERAKNARAEMARLERMNHHHGNAYMEMHDEDPAGAAAAPAAAAAAPAAAAAAPAAPAAAVPAAAAPAAAAPVAGPVAGAAGPGAPVAAGVVFAAPGGAAPRISNLHFDLAPTGRARCAHCNGSIHRGSTRATMVGRQSRPHYHGLCIPNGIFRITGIYELPDQQKREMVEFLRG